MNNKPVAYGMLTFCKNCGEQNPYAVKELTDEEINQVWEQCKFDNQKNASLKEIMMYMAKAIIKKVQEK